MSEPSERTISVFSGIQQTPYKAIRSQARESIVETFRSPEGESIVSLNSSDEVVFPDVVCKDFSAKYTTKLFYESAVSSSNILDLLKKNFYYPIFIEWEVDENGDYVLTPVFFPKYVPLKPIRCTPRLLSDDEYLDECIVKNKLLPESDITQKGYATSKYERRREGQISDLRKQNRKLFNERARLRKIVQQLKSSAGRKLKPEGQVMVKLLYDMPPMEEFDSHPLDTQDRYAQLQFLCRLRHTMSSVRHRYMLNNVHCEMDMVFTVQKYDVHTWPVKNHPFEQPVVRIPCKGGGYRVYAWIHNEIVEQYEQQMNELESAFPELDKLIWEVKAVMSLLSMRPEGDMTSKHDVEEFLCELYDMREFQERTDGILASVSNSSSIFGNCVSLSIKIFGALTALSTANNKEDILRIAIGILSQQVSPDVIDQFTRVLEAKMIEPQGMLDNISGFRNSISSLKTSIAALDTIPGYKMLKEFFTIILFFGLKPSSLTSDTTMSTILSAVEQSVDVSGLDVMMSCMNISERLLEIFEIYLGGGDVKTFLVPQSLFSRVSKLDNRYKFIKLGSYADVYNNKVEDFVAELNSALAEVTSELKRGKLHPTTRIIYVGYENKLTKISEDIKARSQSFQLRMKPHCVVVYGPSDVGKTTVLNQIIAASGVALDVDVSLKRRWYANENDDYDSDHRQDMTVGIWDDAGNAKNDGTQAKYHIGSRLIKIVNNVPAYSIQAEADKKGQIQYKFDIIALTTNVLELGAYSTSNEPYSILRRGDFVEVRVKARFQSQVAAGKLDPSQALVYENGIQVPLHELRIFRWVEDVNGKIDQLTLLDFCCISKAIPFLCEKWKAEREQQRHYVNVENKAHLIPRCEKCYQPRTPAWCHCEDVTHVTPEEMEEFWNSPLKPEANVVAKYLMNSTFSSVCGFFLRIPIPECMAAHVRPYYLDVTEHAIALATNTCDVEAWTSAVGLFGAFVSIDLRVLLCVFIIGLFSFYSNKMFFSVKSKLFNVFCLLFLVVTERITNSFLMTLLTVVLYFAFLALNMIVFTRDVFQMELERRIRAGGNYLEIRTLPFIKYSLVTVTALSGIVMMKKMWNGLKPIIVAQSDLLPQNNDEVAARHAKKNDWLKVEPARITASVNVKSMTYEQVVRRISPHLLRFTFENDDVRVRGMGIAISASLILAPLHSLGKYASVGDQLQYDTRPKSLSTRGTANIIKIYNIPGRDFTIVQIDKQLPVNEKFLDFIPEIYHEDAMFCNMVTLRDEISEQKVLYRFNKNVDNGVHISPGSIHRVNSPTEVGDCMSPLVSLTNPHMILGFHCGGNGTDTAACFTLLRGELKQAMDHFRTVIPEGRISVVKVNDWDDYRYPVAFLGLRNKNCDNDQPIYDLQEEAHERAVVNYVRVEEHDIVPPDCAFFGYDEKARFQPRSNIQITQFSKHLETHGWERLHGRPDFRFDRNHATYFQIGVRGIATIPKTLLELCMSDYVNPILEHFVKVGYKPAVTRVLTLHEALNGHPRTIWIKSIDEKTSAGCGLPKQKANHLDIVYEENGKKTFWAKEYVINEVNEMYETLSRGELVSPITRTSLKDEPTKLKKDGTLTKVRMFAVFPMSFFLLGKMIFGPILAALYDFPLLTELLQGVNCTNRQWDELKRYILDFSPHQALEGDYSKYDANLSGQMIRAAGSILVAIGRFLGYSSQELLAAHTYVCDVSMNPWMFAGSAIVLDKMNPSGNYLTIAINGICNALLHRCAWYSLKPNGLEGTFRDFVRLGTVGDDSIATTRNEWFNMRNIQRYFASINMPYTDGHKSSIVPEFFEASEVVLCKRTFRYEPRVDCFVAPLAVESIGRALHCKKKFYLDEWTLTAQCIISQLRELARHDEETFLFYREIIRKAADDYGIGSLILELSYSYDDWWGVLGKDFNDLNSPSASESSLTDEYEDSGQDEV